MVKQQNPSEKSSGHKGEKSGCRSMRQGRPFMQLRWSSPGDGSLSGGPSDLSRGKKSGKERSNCEVTINKPKKRKILEKLSGDQWFFDRNRGCRLNPVH